MKKLFFTFAVLLGCFSCVSAFSAANESVTNESTVGKSSANESAGFIQGPKEAEIFLIFDPALKKPIETRTISLEQKGNVQYLTIPADSIPAGTHFLEVRHPWASADAGEDGFFVFCNGMYGTFEEGSNSRFQNSHVIMPTFGVKTPRGAMSVIMTGLRYEAMQICDRRDNRFHVFPSYALNNLVNDKIYSDIKLEFHLLPQTATYGDMARVYRNYQLANGTVKPLKEKLAGRPELEYAAGAMEVRVRMGWKPVPSPVKEQTAETEPEMKAVITFDRFKDIVDEFKKQGVDRAEFCLVGWNIGGHDGRYPQIFPADPRLGGTEKMKEAVKYAQENGYQVVCHTNYSDAYSVSHIGGRWDENFLLRKKDGSTNTYTTWGGGAMYETCPECMFKRFPDEDFPEILDCGFRGIHYIDVYSTVNPRTCHSKDHPATKEDFAIWTKKIFEKTQKTFGGMGSEGGFDYAISNLDYALYISFYNPGTPTHALVKRHVPFWHMVYNGIVLNNPYCATTNYQLKDPLTKMKLVEFGGRPIFYFYSKFRHSGTNWMGEEDLICGTDEELTESVKAIKHGYDEFESMKELQFEFFEEHAEMAPNVFRSLFSNGTQIICNYSEKEFQFEGKTVKPMSYEVFK